MRVIGISGKAEAGKDTVASFITLVYPGLCARRAFADALKVDAARVWARRTGLTVAEDLSAELTLVLANDWKVASPYFRSFLQEYGQEMRRANPEYWIQRCAEDHRRGEDRSKVLVIPDVRYQNEAAFIRDNDGLLLRVLRPYHTNRLTSDQRAHSSETDLDEYEGFDAFLVNDEPANLLRQTLLVVGEYLSRVAQRQVIHITRR